MLKISTLCAGNDDCATCKINCPHVMDIPAVSTIKQCETSKAAREDSAPSETFRMNLEITGE